MAAVTAAVTVVAGVAEDTMGGMVALEDMVVAGMMAAAILMVIMDIEAEVNGIITRIIMGMVDGVMAVGTALILITVPAG